MLGNPRISVKGPPTALGERRQVCERALNDCAQWADSAISSAPCWPSGATTRAWTAAGSTARHESAVVAPDHQPDLDQQLERGVQLAPRRRCARRRPRCLRRSRSPRRGASRASRTRSAHLAPRAWLTPARPTSPWGGWCHTSPSRHREQALAGRDRDTHRPAARRNGTAGRRGVSASGVEARLQRVELAPEHRGKVVAELLEPLLDLRQLGLPLLGVDREGLRELGLGEVEAVDVERRRAPARGRSGSRPRRPGRRCAR